MENRLTRSGSKAKPRLWQWISLGVIVCALIGLAVLAKFASGGSWREFYLAFPDTIESMGVWGHLGIIGLMIIHCFVPFPAEFVALAAGGIYGTVWGTVLVWVGAMLGASFSFALTRWFGKPVVEWVLPERQRHMLDRWTEDQGAITLLISRFIPVIAFNLINYAAGLTKVSWWTFLWTTGVGILPLTTLMVYMGSHMRSLSWEWLLAVSTICILMMGIAHWVKRRVA